jgi:ArsR family transcriptional regulator
MKNTVAVTKALADPNRMLIMKMLAAREMCVCELTAVLGLSQPTVSKHLKVLENAGLAVRRKNGPWTDYRVPEDLPGPAAAILDAVLASMEGDAGVREVLTRAANVNRGRINAA